MTLLTGQLLPEHPLNTDQFLEISQSMWSLNKQLGQRVKVLSVCEGKRTRSLQWVEVGLLRRGFELFKIRYHPGLRLEF